MGYLFFSGDDRFGALGVPSSDQVYSPKAGGPLARLADAQSLSQVDAKISAK